MLGLFEEIGDSTLDILLREEKSQVLKLCLHKFELVEHGVNEIALTYIPSTKNSLVYDLLQILGFKKTRLKNHFSTSVHKFKENVNLLPHHINVVR